MKGGVGKTTICAHLAMAFARFHNKKVLLVDLDPQFNTTQMFLKPDTYIEYLENKNTYTVYDIFKEIPKKVLSTVTSGSKKSKKSKITIDNVTINIYNSSGRLDLIPSDLELMILEGRGIENKLNIFLKRISDKYDYIFIDCPPTMSVFTASAYLASDAYFIPIKPDHLSSVGLPLIERAIESYKTTYGKEIVQIGIIFNMVRQTNLMKQTKTSLRSSQNCFNSEIKLTTDFASAVQYQKLIFDYKPTGEHATAMKQLSQELLDKL